MEQPEFDFRIKGRPLKVGIISGELFAPKITGIGGFGWAAKQLSQCFSQNVELGIEAVLLMARKVEASHTKIETLHGSRVLWRTGTLREQFRRIQAEKFDLLVSIDNQAIYRLFFWAVPRTPILFWIRDPWPPADKALIQSLKIPGSSHPPRGTQSRDMRSFCLDYYLSQALGRPMSFAVPAPFLADKILPTYGFQPAKIHYLPNILARNTRPVQKFTKPTVIVVGRLDPIKRPWLAVALAEKFPTVDFIFLGENHFKGAGGWEAEALPANVQMLGHVDGEQKAQLMSSAWVLLNTSIHEGLPVTFQESLAWETPIISCVNPDQVTAHFGIFVGDANGTGLQILPKFEAALNTLLHDSDRREYLGKAGRIWIESTHNQANFLSVFHSLCQEMNLFL